MIFTCRCIWRTASYYRVQIAARLHRAPLSQKTGRGRGIDGDGEQVGADVVMKVTGKIAPLLLLQRQ